MPTYPDFVDVYTYDYDPDNYDGVPISPAGEYVNGNLTRVNFAENPTFIDLQHPYYDPEPGELRTDWSLTDGSSLYVGPNLRFAIWRSTPNYVQITGRYAGQKVYNSSIEVIAETTSNTKTLVITPEMAVLGPIYLGEGYWDNHLQTLTASELGRVFKATDPPRFVIRKWDTYLSWTDRQIENGVDRGVAYLENSAVAWHGLTAVSESPDTLDIESYYLDGVRRLNVPSTYEVDGEISAFSLPEALSSYLGMKSIALGFYGSNIRPKPFGLSYRTQIGGAKEGYKIHILYNVTMNPTSKEFETLSDSSDPSEFSWEFKTMPVRSGIGVGSSSFELDSRLIDPVKLATIESILYGYDVNEARLPTPDEIVDILAAE